MIESTGAGCMAMGARTRAVEWPTRDDDDDYYDDFDKKRGMRRDASFSAGSALRETDEQIFRVFQLFDPKNTKLDEILELLKKLNALAHSDKQKSV